MSKKPSRFTRSTATRGLPKQTFLIVCEGEKTEPMYFSSFKVKSARVYVEGKGFNTVSLVTETQRLVDSYKVDDIEFDQVWCVFDRDNFRSSFNKAIFLAQSKGFRVAYSNEAFELWYLLHFIFFDSSITRYDYIEKLTKRLGKEYQKNSVEMYNILLPRQLDAMKNATKLQSRYDGRNPNKQEPSTTVHLLVGELNKCL